MKDNKEIEKGLAYESLCIELIYWEDDILATNDGSTEADGGEYPDNWN